MSKFDTPSGNASKHSDTVKSLLGKHSLVSALGKLSSNPSHKRRSSPIYPENGGTTLDTDKSNDLNYKCVVECTSKVNESYQVKNTGCLYREEVVRDGEREGTETPLSGEGSLSGEVYSPGETYIKRPDFISPEYEAKHGNDNVKSVGLIVETTMRDIVNLGNYKDNPNHGYSKMRAFTKVEGDKDLHKSNFCKEDCDMCAMKNHCKDSTVYEKDVTPEEYEDDGGLFGEQRSFTSPLSDMFYGEGENPRKIACDIVSPLLASMASAIDEVSNAKSNKITTGVLITLQVLQGILSTVKSEVCISN